MHGLGAPASAGWAATTTIQPSAREVIAMDNRRMPTPDQWVQDGYVVSTDPARLDVDRIHAFLSAAYWSPGIPRAVVARAIENSLPFGLYAASGEQVGFARAISDRATYAYLADVYVEASLRGRGLGRFLVACVLGHPELQDLRRWALATADAHGLYERYGFEAAAQPDMHMFIERSPSELWAAPPQHRHE
jgi:GNAT superfamily N-acetyltransferase